MTKENKEALQFTTPQEVKNSPGDGFKSEADLEHEVKLLKQKVKKMHTQQLELEKLARRRTLIFQWAKQDRLELNQEIENIKKKTAFIKHKYIIEKFVRYSRELKFTKIKKEEEEEIKALHNIIDKIRTESTARNQAIEDLTFGSEKLKLLIDEKIEEESPSKKVDSLKKMKIKNANRNSDFIRSTSQSGLENAAINFSCSKSSDDVEIDYRKIDKAASDHDEDRNHHRQCKKIKRRKSHSDDDDNDKAFHIVKIKSAPNVKLKTIQNTKKSKDLEYSSSTKNLTMDAKQNSIKQSPTKEGINSSTPERQKKRLASRRSKLHNDSVILDKEKV